VLDLTEKYLQLWRKAADAIRDSRIGSAAASIFSALRVFIAVTAGTAVFTTVRRYVGFEGATTLRFASSGSKH
jgi:hypothetical protein